MVFQYKPLLFHNYYDDILWTATKTVNSQEKTEETVLSFEMRSLKGHIINESRRVTIFTTYGVSFDTVLHCTNFEQLQCSEGSQIF